MSDDRDGLKILLSESADRYDGRYGWNQASLFRWLIEEGAIGMWDVTFAAPHDDRRGR